VAVVWREPDIDIKALSKLTVAVLGYGSQGRAQAANLRDSGIAVIVGIRQGGNSFADATADGFDVRPFADAVADADVVAMLVPESAHGEILDRHVHPTIRAGTSLVFAHGYTVVFGPTRPREDIPLLLVAPKAIGPQLRRLYTQGGGAAALIATQGGDVAIAKSYACALGCGRAAVIESSFREETETDLFSEQVLLCGGLPALANAAFETLVKTGYSPESAYFECLFEVKLIADMMFERGIAGMIDRISDTAQFGAMEASDRIISDAVRANMKAVLAEIKSGEFAARLDAQRESSMRDVAAWRKSLRQRGIEAAHAALSRPGG
jgi:ketol-acid reductoisomerase